MTISYFKIMTSRYPLNTKGTSLSINENSIPQASDSKIGIGDLFLPSSYLFMALYYPLFLIARNLSGSFLPWIVGIAYPIIFLLLYLVKRGYIQNNREVTWINIINNNIGLGFVDICIVIVAVVLLILSIIGKIPMSFLPVLLFSLVGVIVNSFFYERIRVVEDPYEAWNGEWRKRRFKPIPQSSDNIIDIHFSWVDILAKKRIKGNDSTDSFVIQLPQADYEGANPRVRVFNPFFNSGLHFEDDRETYTNIILDGADKSLQNAGEKDCYEDMALTQIVNSAYEVCKRYNLADFEMYDLILMFCQTNIEYKLDDECESINNIEEYYRFASETLYDRTGDCDCKAVLAYKLFELLGVAPQFVIVKANHEDAYNHAAIVLRDDADSQTTLPPQYKEYAPGKGVYCEATADGNMHPGDIPDGVDYSSMKFMNRNAKV